MRVALMGSVAPSLLPGFEPAKWIPRGLERRTDVHRRDRSSCGSKSGSRAVDVLYRPATGPP